MEAGAPPIEEIDVCRTRLSERIKSCPLHEEPEKLQSIQSCRRASIPSVGQALRFLPKWLRRIDLCRLDAALLSVRLVPAWCWQRRARAERPPKSTGA